MYRPKISEFEIHATAYGILRKNLYPKFLVRGEYSFPKELGRRGARPDISIFKTYPDKEPVLVCTVEVKATKTSIAANQAKKYENKLGVPCVVLRGLDDAYAAIRKVMPWIEGKTTNG